MMIWGNDLMFSFEEPECYTLPLKSAYKITWSMPFFLWCAVFFLKPFLECQHFLVGVYSVAVCSLLSSDVVLRETI